MTARELIEQEYMGLYCSKKLDYDMATSACVGEAAERVIDRLQRRVEELEQERYSYREITPEAIPDRGKEEALDMKTTASAITMLQRDEERLKRERYRDRLDRMVAALGSSGWTESMGWDDIVPMAKEALAAIDAAVEERK